MKVSLPVQYTRMRKGRVQPESRDRNNVENCIDANPDDKRASPAATLSYGVLFTPPSNEMRDTCLSSSPIHPGKQQRQIGPLTRGV